MPVAYVIMAAASQNHMLVPSSGICNNAVNCRVLPKILHKFAQGRFLNMLNPNSLLNHSMHTSLNSILPCSSLDWWNFPNFLLMSPIRIQNSMNLHCYAPGRKKSTLGVSFIDLTLYVNPSACFSIYICKKTKHNNMQITVKTVPVSVTLSYKQGIDHLAINAATWAPALPSIIIFNEYVSYKEGFSY